MIGKVWLQQKWAVYEIRDEFNFFFSFFILQVYLKSILKEIGTYNTKNPHKNMWELKPEYRHYETSKEDGSSS